MIMRWVVVFFLLLRFSSALALPLDGVVAIVNEQVIVKSQLQEAVKEVEQELLHNGTPLPSPGKLEFQVLEHLIDENLQLQLAYKMKIKATNGQIDQAIQNIAKSQGLVIEQLKTAIAKQGIDFARFRKRIVEQIIISQLQQQVVGRNITVDEKEVQELMHKAGKITPSEYHIADILISVPGNVTTNELTTAKKRAIELATRLRQVDFNKAITAEAGDAISIKWHDLGWRNIEELPTIFLQPLQNMQVGDISNPIQAPNGWHILKLINVHSVEKELTLAQAQELAYKRKFAEKLNLWLQQLRNSAYIKILLVENSKK